MKERKPEMKSLGWIILLVAAVMVGAVSASRSQEECMLRVDPNGGSWMGSSHAASFEMRKGGTMNVPEPEREHYEFAGWVLGEKTVKETAGNAAQEIAFAEETELTMEGEDVFLTALWTPEECSVVCIDLWEEEELGRSESTADYGTRVRGSDWGDDTAEDAYYEGYTYTGCTTLICGDGENEVHRMFEPVVIETDPADSSMEEPVEEDEGKNSVLSGLFQKVRDKENNEQTEQESAE